MKFRHGVFLAILALSSLGCGSKDPAPAAAGGAPVAGAGGGGGEMPRGIAPSEHVYGVWIKEGTGCSATVGGLYTLRTFNFIPGGVFFMSDSYFTDPDCTQPAVYVDGEKSDAAEVPHLYETRSGYFKLSEKDAKVGIEVVTSLAIHTLDDAPEYKRERVIITGDRVEAISISENEMNLDLVEQTFDPINDEDGFKIEKSGAVTLTWKVPFAKEKEISQRCLTCGRFTKIRDINP